MLRRTQLYGIPPPEQAKKKVWEVEPEKPEDIFIWGVCQENGNSVLFSKPPCKTNVGWTLLSDIFPGKSLPKNIFPTDKPQKFKLVPVEEEE
jgi:hypothetical protein